MKISEITNQAVNRWDYILSSLGIKVGNGKHCACPICGGNDRFRFDNKDGRGTYYCNQCKNQAGDGLELVKSFFKCSAKEASIKVAECLNLNVTQNHNNQIPDNQVIKTGVDESYMCDNPVCKKVEYLLSQSELGQSEYLTKKGLTFDLPLLDNGRIFVPLLNLHNEYTGGQFIEVDGSKQLMKGTIKKGAFIAVNPPTVNIRSQLEQATEIVICEGVATGITMAEFQHRSIIISAIDAGNLIHVARSIREVNPTAKIIIAGDNDIGNDKNTGKDKAIEAAKAVKGYYSIPDTDYKCDWDDYRQKHGIDKTQQAFDENLKNEPVTNIQKAKAVPDLSQMQASQRADVLIEHYNNALSLNINTNEVYIYEQNAWQLIPEIKLKRELATLFRLANVHYSDRGIKSTIDTMKLSIPVMGVQLSNLIGFNNGVFDLDDRKFKPHKKEHWLQAVNKVDFITSGNCLNLKECAPNFYKWLNHASNGEEEKMEAIKAALYMILTRHYDWQLFLEVTGAGGSGKSMFSEIATLLVGENNTASSNMKSIDTPEGCTLVVGKALLILPDQAKYMGQGNGLKSITGCDAMEINQKYSARYSSRVQAIVLITNNNPMRFDNDDGAISRRRVIFHFTDTVPANKRDPLLKDKITSELSIIIRHLLDHFSDEQARELLNKHKDSLEALEVKKRTNPLIDFCSYLIATDTPDQMMIGNKSSVKQYRRFLFHAYLEYLESNGFGLKVTRMSFMNELPAALKEYGMIFLKSERTKEGFRTNLYLDEEKASEWLPIAAPESNIKQ